jgi:hypothetical protein
MGSVGLNIHFLCSNLLTRVGSVLILQDFGKYIADWSVKHKNTYGAMYDVSVFSNKYKAIQQSSNLN